MFLNGNADIQFKQSVGKFVNIWSISQRGVNGVDIAVKQKVKMETGCPAAIYRVFFSDGRTVKFTVTAYFFAAYSRLFGINSAARHCYLPPYLGYSVGLGRQDNMRHTRYEQNVPSHLQQWVDD